MKNIIALVIISLLNGSLYYQIKQTKKHEIVENSVNYNMETTKTDASINYSAPVTDIDENSYQTVIIGDQCWMAENLKVSRYPNGDFIPYINSDKEWSKLVNSSSEDAYSHYNNNQNNEVITYGALYTYAAAIGDNWKKDNKDKQGVCPDGWHLPTNEDWDALNKYLGNEAGSKLAGNDDLWSEGKLKQNESFGRTSFSAVPSGYRYSVDGTSEYVDFNAYWWTSKEDSPTFAYLRGLNHFRGTVNKDAFQKSNGFSVRCVKN